MSVRFVMEAFKYIAFKRISAFYLFFICVEHDIA